MTPSDLWRAASLAVEEGACSPCAKSKRGVIVWSPGNAAFAVAHNAPPRPFTCDGSPSCRAACGRICVHAEQAALLQYGPCYGEVHMLHVKVVNGQAVPSGPPSCADCSKLILASGVTSMWLLHDDGLREYSAVEFHRLTLEHLNLPRGEGAG